MAWLEARRTVSWKATGKALTKTFSATSDAKVKAKAEAFRTQAGEGAKLGDVRWLVGWREPGSAKRIYDSFHDNDSARTFKRELERKLDAKEYTPKADRAVKLADYIARVLASERDHLEASTLAWYEGASKLVNERLGHRPIGEISKPELQGFMDDLRAEGVGNGRLHSIHALLTKTFGWAVDEHVLPISPLGKGRTRVRAPKKAPRKVEPMDASVIEALADAIDPHFRLAVLLAGYAGLRGGEVGGLRAQDVDLDRRLISIRQQVRIVAGRAETAEPKTEAARRGIPVPSFLKDEIARHIEDYGTTEDGRLFRASGNRYASGTGEGLVSYLTLNKRLAVAARKLGIPKPRFHDLRHTFASLLIQQGANPKMIQVVMGHTNISVTMDTYASLFSQDLELMADKLDSVRSKALAGARRIPVLAETAQGS